MGILRLILALSVIFGHGIFSPHLAMVRGDAAVYAFFVISGFYISMVIYEKYHRFDHWQKHFLINRILRLFPSYLIVLAAALATKWYFDFPTVFDDAFKTSQNLYLSIVNVFIVGIDFTQILIHNYKVFSVPFEWRVNPPAWSLSAELLFYFSSIFIFTKAAPKTILARTFVFVCLAFILRFYFLNQGDADSMRWTQKFFGTQIGFFLAGFFSYLIFKKIRHYRIKLWQSYLLVLALAAFCYLTALSGVDDVDSLICYVFYSSTVLLIPFLFVATRYSKFDNFLGKLSFPVYILHIPTKEFMDSAFPALNIFVKSGIIVALTGIFAVLLIIFVENPIDKKFRSALGKKS